MHYAQRHLLLQDSHGVESRLPCETLLFLGRALLEGEAAALHELALLIEKDLGATGRGLSGSIRQTTLVGGQLGTWMSSAAHLVLSNLLDQPLRVLRFGHFSPIIGVLHTGPHAVVSAAGVGHSCYFQAMGAMGVGGGSVGCVGSVGGSGRAG
eukprot:SAG31_NODE_511_length_14722_cov_14.770499_4_plen_153_part_00